MSQGFHIHQILKHKKAIRKLLPNVRTPHITTLLEESHREVVYQDK